MMTMDDHAAEDQYDVVVAGAGAAGLSGALVLVRARRRVLVVDAGAPRNAPAAHMQGFLSRDGMPPPELLAAGRAEVRGYGGEMVTDLVTGAVRDGHGFRVTLGGGRVVSARRLLVATGSADELPDVPGVRERWGRDVLHCPYCHGWEVRDQPLGVLGSGPMAVHQALLVRQWSSDVTLFLHTLDEPTDEDRDRLAARGVQVVTGRVTGLQVETGRLRGVRLADGTVVARTALFVGPRLVAHDGLLTALGAQSEHSPVASWVTTDPTGATTVPGVWAAGNVADPTAQVIGAAGAGSRAAIAINGDLVAEDTRRAVAARSTASRADAAGSRRAAGHSPG